MKVSTIKDDSDKMFKIFNGIQEFILRVESQKMKNNWL